MNETLLRTILVRHEGYKRIVYKDTLGNLTGGIGHLCDSSFYENQPLSDQQVEDWYDEDVRTAIAVAKQAVNCFDALGEVRQVVMIDLAFNLSHRLYQFKNFIENIEQLEWSHAAGDLRDSLWYSQVGVRGSEDATAIELGFFGFM